MGIRGSYLTYFMQKKNKKEIIAELLVSGTFSPEQIALKAGTSVEYVTKTKSILKKAGRLPNPIDTRPSSEASVPPAVEHTLDQVAEKMRTRNVDSRNVDIQTLSSESRKMLYFQFVSGFHPTAIIATTGLPSEIVESEYKTFLRLKGQDLSHMQRNLFNIMVEQDFKDESLEELKKGQMSLGGLLRLIVSFSVFQFRNGVQQSVDNRFLPLPDGWKRMICSRCGIPIEGLVIKPTELLGQGFENFLTAYPGYSRKCGCYTSLQDLAEYLGTIKRDKEDAEKLQRALNSTENSDST